MKKLLVFLVTTFLTVGFSHAESNPKIKQFLEKVNLYYYCLNREGLHQFSCEVQMNLPQVMEQVRERVGGNASLLKGLHNEKFYVNYFRTGKLTFSLRTIPKRKDTALNKDLNLMVKAAADRLGRFLRFFNSINIHPLFTKENLAQINYEVRTRDNGFDVHFDGTQISFDKLVRIIPSVESVKTEGTPEPQFKFLRSTKGWLLSQILDEEINGLGRYKVEYRDFKGFQVPKILTVYELPPHQSGVGDKGLMFIFKFSNYH